jgi:hypothetical protein
MTGHKNDTLKNYAECKTEKNPKRNWNPKRIALGELAMALET